MRTWDRPIVALAAVVAGCLLTGTVYLIPGAVEWPWIQTAVVAHVTVLAAAAFAHAALVASPGRAAVLFAVSLEMSWAAEAAGVQFGVVFGTTYQYAGFLGPQLPGGVPLIIPLSWFGLSHFSLLLTDVAMARWPLAGRALMTGYTMAVVDLLLDPISTALGAWVWDAPGPYYGVPLGNFRGWFLVGTTIAAVYLGVTGPRGPEDERTYVRRRFGVLAGLAMLALPALLAVLQGRSGAAGLFALGLAPVVWGWARQARPARESDPT